MILAQSFEKTKKNYLRPNCELGNLRGPEGNAFSIMANVSAALKKEKFLFEANEVFDLFQKWGEISYEAGIDKMSYFVDYSEKMSYIDEDDEFYYAKIKKDNSSLEALQTPLHTKIYSVEQLHDLLQEYDINEKNCFGRNILFSNHSEEIFKEILNNTDINVFDLDNMNSHPLYCIKNPVILNLILQKMVSIDENKTLEILNSSDIFGRNFLDNFLMNTLQETHINDFDFAMSIVDVFDGIPLSITQGITSSKSNNSLVSTKLLDFEGKDILSFMIPNTNITLINILKPTNNKFLILQDIKNLTTNKVNKTIIEQNYLSLKVPESKNKKTIKI